MPHSVRSFVRLINKQKLVISNAGAENRTLTVGVSKTGLQFYKFGFSCFTT